MIPRADGKPISTNAALAVWEAIKDGAPGTRHLLGVVEPAPKGLTRATVMIALVGPDGARSGTFSGTESLTFEHRSDARAFVCAWTRYRVVKNKQPRAGGPLDDSGRHP